MKRFSFAVAATLALLAGCGGEGEKTAAPDPGRTTLGAFIRAAGRTDTEAMGRLLTPASLRALGPAGIGALATRLKPLARRFTFVVSERITDTFGVAAVTSPSGRGAFGAALRRVKSSWRLELAGRVHARPLGPDPGAVERNVRQIAAAGDGAGGHTVALLYLDGLPLDAKISRLDDRLTIYANLPARVPAGRHAVVAFVGAPRGAAATAWMFSVPR